VRCTAKRNVDVDVHLAVPDHVEQKIEHQLVRRYDAAIEERKTDLRFSARSFSLSASFSVSWLPADQAAPLWQAAQTQATAVLGATQT
jgi:hypothetical protein